MWLRYRCFIGSSFGVDEFVCEDVGVGGCWVVGCVVCVYSMKVVLS